MAGYIPRTRIIAVIAKPKIIYRCDTRQSDSKQYAQFRFIAVSHSGSVSIATPVDSSRNRGAVVVANLHIGINAKREFHTLFIIVGKSVTHSRQVSLLQYAGLERHSIYVAGLGTIESQVVSVNLHRNDISAVIVCRAVIQATKFTPKVDT